MRISDWSSDVCSSDLAKADVTAAFAGVDVECGGGPPPDPDPVALENGVPVTDMEIGTNHALRYTLDVPAGASNLVFTISGGTGDADLYVQFAEIGRASCRERVGQSV